MPVIAQPASGTAAGTATDTAETSDSGIDRPRASADFAVTGMTCGACSARVQKILRKQPGVDDAVVNLATHGARVEFDPSVIGTAELSAAVTRAGYGLDPRHDGSHSLAAATAQMVEHELLDQRRWQMRTLLAVPLTLGVLALTFLAPHRSSAGVLSAILTLPVLFWSGLPFLIGAARRLRVGTVNMDTLVALGTVSAYALSITELLRPTGGHLHFEMTCLIVTFVALGRWLEARTRARAGHAARSLASLAPPSAHRLDTLQDPGQDIPVEQVLAGDLLQVKPGERLPVDGVVIDGASGIDESMLTGETEPVEATVGHRVRAGTLNTSGVLVIRATAVGSDTVLAGLVEVVEQAQNAKASLQRLADRIAAGFVPVVLAISVVTALVWWLAVGELDRGLLAAVAVLVIACPCALGLATPVALMVASGRGASEGILLKSGAALERGGQIDTVVFDKTGALTAGRFSVVDSWAAPGLLADTVLTQVAAVEAASEHPIAAALVRTANERELKLPPITGFRSTAGHGVEAVVDGSTVSITRPPENSDLPERLNSFISAWYSVGFTVVVARTDTDGVIGAYALSDTVRPEAAGVVAELRAAGITVHLLTGDNAAVAGRVARQLGIKHVVAGALPAEKAAEVARLQAAGHRVAMVGDGINDAAALVQADLGIAVGSGTDVAAQAADIVLLSAAPLESVPASLALTRSAHRVILQNFGWAFGYNLIALPLAATGLLSPAMAGLAMGSSSLCVVANSLTLARRESQGAAVLRPARTAIRDNRLAVAAAWLAPAVMLGSMAVLDPIRWIPDAIGPPAYVVAGQALQLGFDTPAEDGTVAVEVEVNDRASGLAHSGSVRLWAVSDGANTLVRGSEALLTQQSHARYAGVIRLGSGQWTVTISTADHDGVQSSETLTVSLP